MKNFISNGSAISFTAGIAYTSGDIVVFPELVGVAADDIANAAVGVAVLDGEFEYTKIAGTAHAIGDLLDYDLSADSVGKGITPAAGDVTNFAVCTAAAASAAVLTRFRLILGAGTHA